MTVKSDAERNRAGAFPSLCEICAPFVGGAERRIITLVRGHAG